MCSVHLSSKENSLHSKEFQIFLRQLCDVFFFIFQYFNVHKRNGIRKKKNRNIESVAVRDSKLKESPSINGNTFFYTPS